MSIQTENLSTINCSYYSNLHTNLQPTIPNHRVPLSSGKEAHDAYDCGNQKHSESILGIATHIIHLFPSIWIIKCRPTMGISASLFFIATFCALFTLQSNPFHLGGGGEGGS